MSVSDCIKAYKNVAKQAFTPRRGRLPIRPTGSFSATQLEEAIKRTVREFCTSEECVNLRANGKSTINTCRHSEAEFRSSSCAKTYVQQTRTHLKYSQNDYF